MEKQESVKFPDTFKSDDWPLYFTKSVNIRNHNTWVIPLLEKKKWKEGLSTAAVSTDSYLLACAVDLTALHWRNLSERSVFEILAPGALFYYTRKIHRPKEWWRAIWFTRFAKNEKEVRYFVTWTNHLESAGSHPSGALNIEQQQTAVQKLREAEKVIRLRAESPTFLYDPLIKFGKVV